MTLFKRLFTRRERLISLNIGEWVPQLEDIKVTGMSEYEIEQILKAIFKALDMNLASTRLNARRNMTTNLELAARVNADYEKSFSRNGE